MNAVLSWIKEYVDIELSLLELANRLTLAGMEVEGIQVVGLPMPSGRLSEYAVHGLSWEPDKIVVASVSEVMAHPNADRLVLCKLYDGEKEHIVLTGAPNLYPYKGAGKLPKALKVPYAREGARIYDGHQEGQVLTTLKRAKIRGVESYSMICSEKELGISEEHEGVIILDDDAPVGMPLVDYMGDAVLDIKILPNIARTANMLGIAREVAALTGQPLKPVSFHFQSEGTGIDGRAALDIRQPELNPRFVLGLIEQVEIKPSPYWVQRRLRLAGMRPINNIVDATNYAMLDVGEPLHAFDYDVLVQRAGGKAPTIITRTANQGEHLKTLDEADRTLDDYTVLVCDTAGALSIAGVMGGAESEVTEKTRNVLLEGAAWNFINIRKTMAAQKLVSEAASRFSRGVHPAMAERGVRRGLELMRQWSGGVAAKGLIDAYPLPPVPPTNTITAQEVERSLGVRISAEEIAGYLRRLEFEVQVEGEAVRATAPDHRMDIGKGVIGKADLMEEVARIYGYDRIPETVLASAIPPERGDKSLQQEERLRELLAGLGLQEVATYRLTSPERESRLYPPDAQPDPLPYIRMLNPIASDRNVMRHSLLSSLLEVVERNAHLRSRIAVFEMGPVFLPVEGQLLPDEPLRLAIALTGPRHLEGWRTAGSPQAVEQMLNFFDLKGLLEELFAGLHLEGVRWEPTQQPSYHPGKCAQVWIGERQAGVIGEVHPLVRQHYDLPPTPLLAGELDVRVILEAAQAQFTMEPVPSFPPVLEDLAVVVDEGVPAVQVEDLIRQAGGKVVQEVRLFDLYRGEQIGKGKKSLAYSLTYQAKDRTLTDKEAAAIRQKIVRRLEQELGAKLRS